MQNFERFPFLLSFIAIVLSTFCHTQIRSDSLGRDAFRPARCELPESRNGGKTDRTCKDKWSARKCAQAGDVLYDTDGHCKSPLNEWCLKTCGLCTEIRDYAACRSPIRMDFSRIPGDQALGIEPKTFSHSLMEPSGPSQLFQNMSARYGLKLASTRPLIVEIDDFLNSSEVSALVELAERVVRPEDVHNPEVRNVSKFQCAKLWCISNPTVMSVYRKVEQLVMLPAGNFEPIELLRYTPGQHYEAHFDSGPDEQYYPGGPRYLTVFVYLSSVPEDGGGGTLFPKVGLRVAPRAGKLVVWSNVKDAKPWEDEDWAEHEAERLTEGIKYGFNLWVHPRNVRLSGRGIQRCMPGTYFVSDGIAPDMIGPDFLRSHVLSF